MLATIMILTAALQQQLPVQQQPPVQQEPPIIVEGQKLREKPICRTERQTGSRVVRQICRTSTEQRQADLDARNKIRLGTSSTRPTEAFKPPKGE